MWGCLKSQGTEARNKYKGNHVGEMIIYYELIVRSETYETASFVLEFLLM